MSMKSTFAFYRKQALKTLLLLGIATLSATLTSMAGESDTNMPAATPAEPPPPPFVTGVLSLMVDTHFISYGQDVWGAGTSWDDPLFHPSRELSFDLGKGFNAVLGTWWDCNNNAASSIGDAIQEVDVWAGVAYTYKQFKFALTYQEWMYNFQNERILDFKVTYAHWLNPSVMVHGRLAGAEPFDTGAVLVLGVAPAKTFGIVSLSAPFNVSFDTVN